MAKEVNNKPKIKALFMRKQSANFIIKDIETDKNYVFENNPNNPWVEGELLRISVENTRRSGKHKIFLKGTVVDSAIDIRALDITPLKLHDLGEWDPFEDLKYAKGNWINCMIRSMQFLMTATPEEIRQKVRRYVRVGRRGGEFLLYLCNIGSKTPRSNLDAAVEATREYGTY